MYILKNMKFCIAIRKSSQHWEIYFILFDIMLKKSLIFKPISFKPTKNNVYRGEINLEITFNHFIKFKPLYLKKITDVFFSINRMLQPPIFEDFKNILVQNPFLGSHWDLNYLKLIASLQEFYSMACKLNSPAWHLCFIYVNSTGLL